MEYEELKKFFSAYVAAFMDLEGLAPEKRPLAVLESFEKKSLSQAKKGLRITLADCIEDSYDWSWEKVAAFDAELRKNNIVTLTELRVAYGKKFKRVMARGSIKSIDEYYLCKGILDGEPLNLAEPEKLTLDTMLHEYEERTVSRK